ncbi:class II fructose-bisphosphate aldolase [Pelosinus propionicus]|uniref:Fructose-bisphosphate aldolase, class II n=1 Tax=Pelosinus propionicus DSM 13327 TaxID=1123291 RepID=A0A1I4KJ78_9FIRM|nr:class II fructose-bisphosphate aldolase [Pelosinus propionicus]SFL78818.1 fructose-bisphosphate aldolase, class II [Pelosinus propionicus DSM 13327]
MLVDLNKMLEHAVKNNCAIGSFNVYNLESIQAVVKAAQAVGQPAIISFGESYIQHASLDVIAAIVKKYCIDTEIPFVLHLDHSKHFETIVRAISAGFTSVMYDGSSLPLNENIEKTRYVVQIAHVAGVSVEGELGYMNNEDGSASPGLSLEKGYTKPEDAKKYAEASGIDALAIAIGNAHGIYKGIPELDFKRLAEISSVVDIPLVLHGSSGIPIPELQKAIALGIRKININTEISTQAIKTARQFLDKNKQENLRFETLAKSAEQTMSKVIKDYISILN